MRYLILRLKQVLMQRGRSRSAHYLDIQQGLFTPPVLIGSRAVGWPSSEVEAINAARIAGKSNEEIRMLVIDLLAARKVAPSEISAINSAHISGKSDKENHMLVNELEPARKISSRGNHS